VLADRERRTQRVLENILHSTSDYIFVKDLQGRYTMLNPATANLLGLDDPDDALGRDNAELLPDVAGTIASHDATVLADGREESYEIAGHWAGREMTLLVTKSPLRDERGNVVGSVGIARDITERAQMQSALRAAEEHFRRAFYDAPIGMAIIALDGTFREVNDALCRLTGHTAERLHVTTFTELTHPDDRGPDTQARDAMIAGEEDLFSTEKRYIHATGRIVNLAVSSSIVRSPEGDALHFIAQIQDVTARRSLEDQLRHLADHDALTGLVNRRRLEAELESHARERSPERPGALLVLDLDQFKLVNDTLGHHAGDALITAVASTLREQLRETDVVARLGGDEFAVLLPNAGRREAERVASKLSASLSARSYDLGDHVPRRISASIGVAVLDERDGMKALIDADLAMYEAKEAGRDGRVAVAPATVV
jgi:diguanylate cyclase (GGDEF)-like protein/PAS domain S-box-containing protein